MKTMKTSIRMTSNLMKVHRQMHIVKLMGTFLKFMQYFYGEILNVLCVEYNMPEKEKQYLGNVCVCVCAHHKQDLEYDLSSKQS